MTEHTLERTTKLSLQIGADAGSSVKEIPKDNDPTMAELGEKYLGVRLSN